METGAWPYTAADLNRLDNSDDASFYAQPRFVAHIDDRAIESLTAFYSDEFAAMGAGEDGLDVLDTCSSWISHLPTDAAYGRVAGLGMNAAELEKNVQLTETCVRDLNVDPTLPYDDESFDVVCNVVSVDYLVKPQEFFAEVHRVLRPGGRALISFSNRCFQTKAVAMWLQADDIDKLTIVASYCHYAAKFKEIAALDIKLPPLPEELDRESQASAASVQNFPVASEAPEVASVEAAAERDGSIFLPDIDELARRKVTRSSNKVANDALPQIERGDTEALRRAMESDPNADVNFNLFRDKSKAAGATKKDVDIITIALGENADKFFGIESAYLQIGHSALVLVILLATFVYDPSFPLTNLPVEFRDFFKQGLAAVYAVNAVLGGVAYFEAQKRDQPVTLWVVKCLFIGGVAFNQLTTSTRIKKPRR